MTSLRGIIRSGVGEASKLWDWCGIKTTLADDTVHAGTINIWLDSYCSLNFVADFHFPNHVQNKGRCEAIEFQRCRLRLGDTEVQGYIAKTAEDFWGKHQTIEIIAPFVSGASDKAEVEVIVST
ncbi:MAG: hypothetical protein NTZ56_15835 [Acidobacteria bacterium]|nr:hypothetical protein [Acidobacteriota bacterium]